MSPASSRERSEQIRTLFGEVVDLAPQERAAHLGQLHSTDSKLRCEVESLLAAHERADEVLDRLDQQLPWRIPSPAEEPTDPLLGRHVSHYQILEKLSGGGMGIVYKARDLRLERTVALKFLPPHLSLDEGAKRRLIREAKAASALDHPNICTFHEIGETDAGQLFLVLAYYHGETLKKKIAGGPLPLAEALDYASQVAEGLLRAHEAGIVHRDIKPANVLVAESGQVKLVDFGIAKVQGEDLTHTGVTLGTAAYMSPEQARGGAVDHRTDLWSLGVVLYEMLSGVRPFPGEVPEAVVYGIRHDEPPPIETLRPEVSPELARVVQQCLAKDTADRYPSAQALRADLHAAAETSAERERRAAEERVGKSPSLLALAAELKRRSVFRVGAVYAAVSFVLLQVADLIFPVLMLPEWTFSLLLVVVILGFPLALVLAWAYELTPERVRRTPPRKRHRSTAAPPWGNVPAAPSSGWVHFARRWRVWGGAVAVVLLAGVPLLLWRQAFNPQEASAGSEAQIRRSSLAVLPVVNLSGSPEQEYFADGMTDLLINHLSRISGFDRVISRTSVMPYKGTQKSLRQIGQELGVDVLVEASLLREGERVRINVGLIEAATERTLWSESFEHAVRDVLVLQREVALAIARQIELTLTPEDQQRLAGTPPVDPEAFDLYVKGTQARYRGWSEQDISASMGYFARAIARDSGYAPAYAGLATAHVMAVDEARARAFAEKALALDPKLAEPHVVLGLIRQIYDWDWAGSEESFRQAIRLNPGYAEAHHELSMLLMRRRRFDEALLEAQRTLYLAPMSARFQHGLGEVLFFSGRYDEALRESAKAVALDSTFADSYWLQGLAYAWKGRHDEAEETLRKCVSLGLGCNEDDIRANLGHLYAVSGRRAEALKILDTFKARWRREGKEEAWVWSIASNIAEIHAGLGELDQALDWLERAAEEGAFMLYVGISPTFRPLHAEPRFQALLKRVGLEE